MRSIVEEQVPVASPVDDAVRLLRTLSEPTRLRLLGVLQYGEHNVTGLCRRLALPQPTISHHLGLLRSAGLVTNRRDGKQVFYSLNGAAVSQLEPKCGLAISSGPLELYIRDSSADGV